MTDDELLDALLGLYAYDTGSLDSGIHDEALRARVVAELRRRLEDHPHHLLGCDPATTRLVRDGLISDERIAEGYCLEDLASFVTWLTDGGL